MKKLVNEPHQEVPAQDDFFGIEGFGVEVVELVEEGGEVEHVGLLSDSGSRNLDPLLGLDDFLGNQPVHVLVFGLVHGFEEFEDHRRPAHVLHLSEPPLLPREAHEVADLEVFHLYFEVNC